LRAVRHRDRHCDGARGQFAAALGLPFARAHERKRREQAEDFSGIARGQRLAQPVRRDLIGAGDRNQVFERRHIEHVGLASAGARQPVAQALARLARRCRRGTARQFPREQLIEPAHALCDFLRSDPGRTQIGSEGRSRAANIGEREDQAARPPPPHLHCAPAFDDPDRLAQSLAAHSQPPAQHGL